MNSVTCHASGERHKEIPRGSRSDAFASPPPRTRGSHATAARTAGTANSARERRQPRPVCCEIGKLAPAASAAATPIAVEYTLVARPARSGNSRLTRPGKSTLPTAMAAPKTAVPTKSNATGPAERTRMPAARTSRLASKARSMPIRRASRGAPGESNPNASRGSAVSRPATPLDTPVSARTSPIKGGNAVSAGRRFAAKSKIPTTSNTPRTREGPPRPVTDALGPGSSRRVVPSAHAINHGSPETSAHHTGINRMPRDGPTSGKAGRTSHPPHLLAFRPRAGGSGSGPDEARTTGSKGGASWTSLLQRHHPDHRQIRGAVAANGGRQALPDAVLHAHERTTGTGGRRERGKRWGKKRRVLRRRTRRSGMDEAKGTPAGLPATGSWEESVDRALGRASDAPLRTGNGLTLLKNGPETFDEWLEEIGRAEKWVHLELFQFEDDMIGRRFAEALAQKAREGVRVRVLYDWIGSFLVPRSFWRGLRRAGVQVRVVNPPAAGSPLR